MNAMILAAGRGERMRPLTDSCPKPLLEVNGKPLIVYHLEALRSAGIESVVINLSWLGDQVESALGGGERFGLRIRYSREPEALETAGGIVRAMPWLDESFIVINADVFTDFDLGYLQTPHELAHLVLVDNPAHNAAGDFGIEEGMLSNGTGQHYTFAGIACYRKSFFTGLTDAKRPLAPMLQKGAESGQISAELYQGFWRDVGTIERLEELRRQ